MFPTLSSGWMPILNLFDWMCWNQVYILGAFAMLIASNLTFLFLWRRAASGGQGTGKGEKA